VAILFALVYAIAGRSLIALLTGQAALRELSASFLPWMILSALVSFWSFLLDGVFVGATWARDMRNTMLLCSFGIFVPVFYLTQALGLGNHGLWLAFVVFMGARAVTMGRVYRIKMRPAAIS
jgi:MATE family multidrug resistance protein